MISENDQLKRQVAELNERLKETKKALVELTAKSGIYPKEIPKALKVKEEPKGVTFFDALFAIDTMIRNSSVSSSDSEDTEHSEVRSPMQSPRNSRSKSPQSATLSKSIDLPQSIISCQNIQLSQSTTLSRSSRSSQNIELSTIKELPTKTVLKVPEDDFVLVD